MVGLIVVTAGARAQVPQTPGSFANAVISAQQLAATLESTLRFLSGAAEALGGNRARIDLTAVEASNTDDETQQQLELAARTNELQAERIAREHFERRFGIAAIAALAAISLLFMFLFFSLRRLYRALSTRNRELETHRRALANANDMLELQTKALYQAATTDALTGVDNRTHALEQLDLLCAECNLDGRELTVLMIDFDHFKQINDRYGHATGDRILIEGVRAMRGVLAQDCIFGRFGGEEFIVAFSGRDAQASHAIAESLRCCACETILALFPKQVSGATISIGIATLSSLPRPAQAKDIVEVADRAMYAAKSAGRNRVMHLHDAA